MSVPRYQRWTKAADAILRSPLLTCEDVRVYLVVLSLRDTRDATRTISAKIEKIADLASVANEVALASLQRLVTLRLVGHRKVSGQPVWTVKKLSGGRLEALCPISRLGCAPRGSVGVSDARR